MPVAKILEHPASTSSRQCRSLAAALEISKQMLASARSSEWQSVAQLEQERRAHFSDCFAYPLSDRDPRLIEEALAALLHMNEDLLRELQATRDSLAHENAELRQGNEGAKQYLQTGSLRGTGY